MSESLLDISQLSVRLPAASQSAYALRNVTMQLRQAELLCVVGESGSGKSTLAAAILGLLGPGVQVAGGSVRWLGRELLGMSNRQLEQIRGSEIALVGQDPYAELNPLHPVGEQIAEVLRLHSKLKRHQRLARVLELLRYVELAQPEQLRRAYPFQLSGGQRQRVAIAMALAGEPKLLIADELTSALDAVTRMQIVQLLQRIHRDKGMALLLITHDFALVSAMAERVLVMRGGEVLEQGDCQQLLQAPQADYTRRLLAATRWQLRESCSFGKTEPLLLASNLHKQHWRHVGWRRSAVSALHGVSLELRAGETLGIVGESGSGKSTLARALLRLLPLDKGSIRLDGRELLELKGRRLRAIRPQIQMVFQDPAASFNPRRRIGEALIAGPLAQGVERAQAEHEARQMLHWVGLPESAYHAYPHVFSGGQRQRLAIARALLLKPRVLVADECVSALDVLTQEQILELLERLQARFGLALIFITHDLRVAARISDRVLVMQHGQVVENAPLRQLLTAPQHPYTRSLLAAHRGFGVGLGSNSESLLKEHTYD